MATRLARETGRCAEPGCEEEAWLGGEYCIWHPRLELARPVEPEPAT